MTPTGASGGPDRADAMARRLQRTAARLGLGPQDRQRIAAAFHAAMAPRRSRIPDDHHPDYLHPARTALILMDDAAVADPDILVMGIFAETRDPDLSAPIREVERVSPAAAEALARLPLPAREEDRLLESLLALPSEQVMVATAERLDHARHLHLRDRGEWPGYHATTCASYAPVAARVDKTLGARLASWCSTFQRRFLNA